jgi:hypothetical protein
LAPTTIATTTTTMMMMIDETTNSDGKWDKDLRRVIASAQTGAFNTEQRNIDIGLTPLISFDGIVWFDADGNGLQSVDEVQRFANVVLSLLLRDQPDIIASTTTDENGFYSFDSRK